MICTKCKKDFPKDCTCSDKEERLAALSGIIVFPGKDGKIYTPAPVQLKPRKDKKNN